MLRDFSSSRRLLDFKHRDRAELITAGDGEVNEKRVYYFIISYCSHCHHNEKYSHRAMFSGRKQKERKQISRDSLFTSLARSHIAYKLR